MELGKYILYLHKKWKGDLKAHEKKALQNSSTDPGHAKLEQDLEKIWSASLVYKSGYQPDLDRSWDSFAAKLAAEKKNDRRSLLFSPRVRWWALAASVLGLVLFAFLWRLSFAENEGWQTVATVNGETLELVLPDGSRVVLNENSQLKYPPSWEDKPERRVRFVGEAFFQISPNTRQPFRIDTPEAEVLVLGTAFNLRAYARDSFTEVAVTEGGVQLAKRNQPQVLKLQKGELGRLTNHTDMPTVAKFSVENAQSWRTNRLSFRNASLEEISEALERHFAIHFSFQDDQLRQRSFNSDFSGESLDDILNALQIGLSLRIERSSKDTYVLSAKMKN